MLYLLWRINNYLLTYLCCERGFLAPQKVSTTPAVASEPVSPPMLASEVTMVLHASDIMCAYTVFVFLKSEAYILI